MSLRVFLLAVLMVASFATGITCAIIGLVTYIGNDRTIAAIAFTLALILLTCGKHIKKKLQREGG